MESPKLILKLLIGGLDYFLNLSFIVFPVCCVYPQTVRESKNGRKSNEVGLKAGVQAAHFEEVCPELNN